MSLLPLDSTSLAGLHASQHQQPTYVTAYGATGDGTTDDSPAFIAAATAAGSGGTIFAPAGTYVVDNWTPTTSGITVKGVGMGGTVLKAKASAAAAVTISQLARTRWEGVTFDGNAVASDGLRITGATSASSLHEFDHCQFQNAVVGCSVLSGSPTNQADQNTFINCYFTGCTTGFKDVAANGQNQLFLGTRFGGSTTTGMNLQQSGTVVLISCQFAGHTTGVLFSTANISSFDAIDTVWEGAAGAGTTDIDGTSFWPVYGVNLTHCVLRAGASAGTGKTVIMKAGAALHARGCAFVNGDLTANFSNAFIEDLECRFTASATVTMAAGTTRRISRDGGSATGNTIYYKGSGTPFGIDLGNGVILLPKYATASRPAANTAGDGAMYYDTTLDLPGFSDGTNWRDAAGTIV